MSARIPHRRLDFAFDRTNVPVDWGAGDAHVTAFVNALSLLFPEGERFFVRSVRRFSTQLTDPQLVADVAAFIAQEGSHAKGHVTFNAAAMASAGPLASELERGLKRLLRSGEWTFSARGCLAITCALEHLTAAFAETLLSDERFQNDMHETVRPLWLWHALEESEHKAVAFDVYQAVGGGYVRRVAMMLLATAFFLGELTHVRARLLAQQGKLFDVRGWLRVSRHLWVDPGFFATLLPIYADYFRPGFHPADRDTRGLIETWRRKLFGDASGNALAEAHPD